MLNKSVAFALCWMRPSVWFQVYSWKQRLFCRGSKFAAVHNAWLWSNNYRSLCLPLVLMIEAQINECIWICLLAVSASLEMRGRVLLLNNCNKTPATLYDRQRNELSFLTVWNSKTQPTQTTRHTSHYPTLWICALPHFCKWFNFKQKLTLSRLVFKGTPFRRRKIQVSGCLQ